MESVYGDVADEALVLEAQRGDEKAQECIMNRYKNFVRLKARAYFLVGADREDIIQEGMIGLFKATRDYHPDRASSFKSFAELCVRRQIITAIKSATRQKHIPLNSYVSLNKSPYDSESERSYLEMMASGNKELNPEHLMIRKEEVRFLEEKMGEVLSRLEWQVLNGYLEGKSYEEISREVPCRVKSVDNALQRVKKKMERAVQAQW